MKTYTLLIVLFLGLSDCQSNFWINNLYDTLTTKGLREDIQLNALIGSLQYALSSSLGQVSYFTTSPYFSVAQNSGEVRLKQPLKYAVQPQFSATFFARGNNGFEDKVDVIVNVIPVNHAPSFDLPSYILTIQENTVVGSVVYSDMLVTDVDSGPNGTFTINCDTGMSSNQACSTFSLSNAPVAGAPGRRAVTVTLTSPLNFRLIPAYTLNLIAIDNGNPPLNGQAKLQINISNPDDTRPVFLNPPIIFTMTEMDPVDRILKTVEVQDKRQPNAQNSLRFYISGDIQNWFQLSAPTFNSDTRTYSFNIKSTGQVLLETINFDTQYYFTIQAKQVINGQETSVSSETLVTVKISDINNNKPLFMNAPYNINFTEQAGVSTIPGLYMLILDRDLGDNAFFTLSIDYQPSPVSGIFSIVPVFGQGSVSAVILINKPEYVRYDDPNKRSYIITVTAAENRTAQKFSSIETVNLNVLSSINHSPYFPLNIQPIALFDNSKVGTIIVSGIRASDSDQGIAGLITYSMQPYNGNADATVYFMIDPITSMITLAQPISYSTVQQIMINLTATDGLGASAATYVQVTVVSSNTTGPKFSVPQYTTTVLEGQTSMSPPLFIYASPLINDRVIKYMLVGNTYNLFTINSSSGQLNMTKPVDYNDTPDQKGFYLLTCQASYNGWTDQPVTNISIVVTIEDTNNHPPVFNPVTYMKTINETTPPGTPIIKVNATDYDFGPNGKLHYFIQLGGKDNFVIDYTTGNVTLSSVPNLSIDQNGPQYNITIIAVDEGPNPQTGTATLFVNVMDSIYRYPVFNSTNNYIYYVKEYSPIGTSIDQIKAYSPDRRAIINYSIIPTSYSANNKTGSPVPPLSSNDYTQWFAINPTTGTISVYQSTVSYDVAAVVNFNVSINVTNREGGPNPLSTTAAVKILVTPTSVSSDSIIFIPILPADNILRRNIVDRMPVGSVVEIFDSYLNNPSSKNPKITDYTLTPINDIQYLVINQTSGVVSINQIIKYEALQNKTLVYKLVAKAPSPSTATSVTTIYYTIISNAGNKPIFSSSVYNFTIYSNAAIGSPVGNIWATAPAKDSTLIYTYLVEYGISDIFPLNNISGAITVMRPLDSLQSNARVYNLIANAMVVGTNNSGRAQIFINIIPVHTRPPTFDKQTYTFTTSVGNMDTIGQVHAMDRDIFTQSTIIYTLLDNINNAFIINNSTGIISPSKPLSESGTYNLTVVATDTASPPLSSSVNVVINVVKISSTAYPTIGFPTTGASFPVYQNYPIDMIVFRINTSSTRNVSFTYSFTTEECNKYFSVDSNGVVTAKSNMPTAASSLQCALVVTDNGEPKLSTSVNINMNFYSNTPPSFICMSGMNLIINATENTPPVQALYPIIKIPLNSACSNENPNKTFYYSVIEEGSDTIVRDSIQYVPFKMSNTTNGQLTAIFALYWYERQRYKVNIVVATDANDVPAALQRPNSIITVYVNLIGNDSRGPDFSSTNTYCPGIGSSVTIGILDMATMGTPIIKMYAGDCDMPGFTNNLYQIISQTPMGPNGGKMMEEYFGIDPNTGIISTRLADYRKYYQNYFLLEIKATNAKSESKATLYIYIVRETYKLKFVFNKTAMVVRGYSDQFVSAFNMALTNGTRIYADRVTTYVDNGLFKTEQASMCYFMVNGLSKSVMEPGEATSATMKVFQIPSANTPQIFGDIGVTKQVYSCYQMPETTRFWGGYWPVWPTLVALALLVFLVAMILTYCVCWYWPKSKKNIEKNKPYVVLDEPPMSQAGSVMEYH